MTRPPFEDFLPPESKRKNEEVMEAGLDAIQIAEEEGVTVCYGTDLLVSMHALQVCLVLRHQFDGLIILLIDRRVCREIEGPAKSHDFETCDH